VLIVYEGIDGSGKTSSSRRVCAELEARGHTVTVVQWTSFQVRREEEETSVFREADRNRKARKLGPLSYAVWHVADFAFRLEQLVFPALARGEIVVMDRYKYTGYVRDVIRGLDEHVVQSLYTFAPEPDLIVYLDLDPRTAYQRKKNDGASLGYYECGLDLFGDLSEEAAFIAFQSLCRRRYDTILPKSALRLDGGLPKASLNEAVLAAVEAWLSTAARP
jgi:dTMP kinase